MRRLFWLGVGAVAGASGTIWAEHKVRARMEQLIHTTRERGWSAVGNAAVPGVLGVGLPVPGPGARAHFAVSVSSIMSRMPLARQRFIVDVMRHALAGVAIGQIFAGPHDSR